MGWFWKEKKKASSEMEAIIKLSEQNSDLEEQCRLLAEQLTKLSRLQFKTSKDTHGKLDLLNESIGSIVKRQDVDDEKREIREAQLEETSLALINWLDDLDLVYSRLLRDNQDSWKKLLEQWREQIRTQLENLGIHELEVLGSSFDPKVAESIGTVPGSEVDKIDRTNFAAQVTIPYQVVEVVKRGFINANGALLRKAQVITIEEENKNA